MPSSSRYHFSIDSQNFLHNYFLSRSLPLRRMPCFVFFSRRKDYLVVFRFPSFAFSFAAFILFFLARTVRTGLALLLGGGPSFCVQLGTTSHKG